jgi:AraC-like DNA-binding protein
MDHSSTLHIRDDKGILLEQSRRTGQYNMSANHYHDRYELYYLLTGERNYFIRDKTYHIKKGDLVFINAFDLHKTTDGGSIHHERILIHFTEEFLTNMGITQKQANNIDVLSIFRADINVIRLDRDMRSQVESLLFKMIKESKNEYRGFTSILKTTLFELLILMNRFINSCDMSHPESQEPVYQKISSIVKYININYMHHISLELISSQFFISPSYLSRTFGKVTGFSFSEYLNIVRIKEAQKLLRETSFNVTRISELTGYESSTHFGRIFKHITGCSPLRYRRTHTF